MKYNLNHKILDQKGRPIPDEDGNDTTLGMAIQVALLSGVDGEMQPVKGLAKVKRYNIFVRLVGENEIELTPDEVVLIKDAVLAFPTIIVGRVTEILDRG